MATRVISTSIKLDGEAEFKKQMSSVNSELKTLRTEMAYSEEAFKGQANTMEALTAKDKLLRESIEKQTQKVSDAEKMLQKAKDAQNEFAKAIDAAKQKATDQGVSLDRLRGNTESLTDEEKALAKELLNAEGAYDKASKTINSTSQILNRAKTDLLKMNRELDDNSKYLDEARKSADHAADSIDEFGREVKDTADQSDGIADLIGSMSKLKDFAKGGVIGAAAIGGLTAIKDAIFEIVDGTKEYRQIMGTLDVSSQKAGYSAEQTRETYRRLYSVLGDNQSAATTVANLQAIGLSQEDLMEITDAAIGSWATYGDSIPIDGLAESINETIKAGQVTGTFADVLNWGAQEGETFGLMLKDNVEFTELSDEELEKLTETQRAQYDATKAQYDSTKEFNEELADCKTTEDYFNLALQECSDNTERADLVMQAMSKQGLSDAADAWFEVNEDIVKANDAQADWEEATGKLGEVLSPAKDALLHFGADAVEWLTEKIQAAVGWINDAIDAFKRLNDWLNEDSTRRVEEGQARAQARIDGSHAGGLSYVPFDGYISELHAGEAVLTAQENAVWQQFKAGGYQPQPGVTAEQLQAMLVGTVNALNSQRGSGLPQEIDLRLKTDDGQVMGRWLVPFVRSENKSNPEVVSDV